MSKKFLFILFSLSLYGCSDSFVNESSSKTEQYIVVMKQNSPKISSMSHSSQLKALSLKHDVVELKSFSKVMKAAVYRLNKKQAEEMKKDPMVAYVEIDHKVSVYSQQLNPTWGLDRIDQEDKKVDHSYKYKTTASNVHAYVIDTGILISHEDFEGRASHGYDALDEDDDATDCNGHGTHVAGTIGGKKYGVAKEVNLVGVRVLDCYGNGRYSDIIEGVEWVTANHIKPAVANLSLGGPPSKAMEDAIRSSIQAGVSYVVAAGNSDKDACSFSPARMPEVLTVGSIEEGDKRSWFSNYGSCLNLFAPGSGITSAWIDSNHDTNTIDGTSMASPHVAGVVALYLAEKPNAQPAEVFSEILSGSIENKVKDPEKNSPNLLLNTAFLQHISPTEPVPPPQEDSILQAGDELQSLQGEKESEKSFQVIVPEGVEELEVSIHSGVGDADLYINYENEASMSEYICRPYLWGNDETCKLKFPQAGVYHIMLRAYDEYLGLSLSVDMK